MGKKTIRTKFTDTIPKSSMFCQSNEDLLKIYPERAFEGLHATVIRPLEHTSGGYFFYRKDLGNGEMLVSGECYPCSSESEFQEGVYYLDEDHEPNTVVFIEESSLTDDDADFDEKEFDKKKADDKKYKNMQQQLQKLEDSKPILGKETRVYVVDVEECDLIGRSTSDEAFIAEAEKQGTVYSLSKFEEAFNYDDINQARSLIRII